MSTTRYGENRRGGALVSLTLVTLICLCGSGTAWTGGQPPANRAGSRASPSDVWPNTPVLPWSGSGTGASDWASILDKKLDLTRKGRKGEQRRYRIRRQHLIVDRQGRVLARSVSEGSLKRVLLRQDTPGLWTERLEWERFASAQSQGPTDVPKLQEQEKARGISYDFSPRKFDYLNPPGDFARIPDPIVGYFLKVLAMDVTAFDAMLLSLRDRFGVRMRIGDSVRSERWAEAARIGKNREKEIEGRYGLGEATVTVAGITRCQGVPCALIYYSAEGNSVKQEINSPQFRLHMDGTEYFRAEIAVSLLDGHVVAGEVWGPVLSVMELGQGGQSPKELPNAGVIQQVSLWEVR
jgi:hypothetical protein